MIHQKIEVRETMTADMIQIAAENHRKNEMIVEGTDTARKNADETMTRKIQEMIEGATIGKIEVVLEKDLITIAITVIIETIDEAASSNDGSTIKKKTMVTLNGENVM